MAPNATKKRLGFTLIELLVTIAIMAMLLAVLMPALRSARISARRIACQANLKQIALAWHMYLDDNDGYFYQAEDAHNNFGGWTGTDQRDVARPLNRYFGLPLKTDNRQDAEIFRCPGDRGEEFFGKNAYAYFGNSYQTNLMLVGSGEMAKFSTLPGAVIELHSEIERYLENVRRDSVHEPTRLLLVGDHQWFFETQLFTPDDKGWHGKVRHYCLAFLDGHTDFLKIHPGLYIAEKYRTLPFRQLDAMARLAQP